jgi:hypothetical protein
MLVPLLLLGGCGTAPDSDPGALTMDEQRQLNEAAAMLDGNSVATDAVKTEHHRQ